MDRLRQELASVIRSAAVAGALVAAVACARHDAHASGDSISGDSLARARQDSVNRAQPGYIVDSIFPVAEEIRRFNAGLRAVDSLSGGAATREELVRRFSAALARHDSAAVRSLLITRAEFGQLVFPESPYTQAPFRTKPVVIWTQLESESARGLPRLLRRAAGPGVQMSGLSCQPSERQGRNRIWHNCSILLRRTGSPPLRARFFGPIVEREGRAKFLSYASDF